MTEILQGHVLDRLAELEPESVHCVITSPPYWGLRDYGTEPQVWGRGSRVRASLGGGLAGSDRDAALGPAVCRGP
ncbi:MAG: hypothetical protein DMD89_04635 [Candidatus Rokuibacteriota bacterium]|nr:MAG: hypothetical protein DMD89_04635 [Candidatus Rokubacteria bacterium]